MRHDYYSIHIITIIVIINIILVVSLSWFQFLPFLFVLSLANVDVTTPAKENLELLKWSE